jgi:hypothetical protein
MKCINCGHDSRRRDRIDRRCPSCRHPFALDPAECGVSDLAFQNAVKAITEHGRLAWRPRHLYFEVARWRRRRSFFARLTRRPFIGLRYEEFESMLAQWQGAHGTIPGQLPAQTFAAPPDDDDGAPDVADYAFERVVVCDSRATVDLLLANAFHIEHRCPVFSVDGYPEAAFERALPAFRREPPKVAVVVHDADSAGCTLATRVAADARWFRGNGEVAVVDAGLRPGDARRFRGLFERPDSQSADASQLTEGERKWLSKYRLDLHVMRPRALLLALAAAAATPLDELAARASHLREDATEDGVVVVGDEWAWWGGGESDDDYPG